MYPHRFMNKDFLEGILITIAFLLAGLLMLAVLWIRQDYVTYYIRFKYDSADYTYNPNSQKLESNWLYYKDDYRIDNYNNALIDKSLPDSNYKTNCRFFNRYDYHCSNNLLNKEDDFIVVNGYIKSISDTRNYQQISWLQYYKNSLGLGD